MTVWLVAGLVLLVAAVGPALYRGSRGRPIERLVGLELTGSLAVLALLLLSFGYGQPTYLIVPLVLALLSFAGTLVFTRLIGARR